MIVYIEQILVIADMAEQMESYLVIAADKPGFCHQHTKVRDYPTQQIDFLGMKVDSTSQQLRETPSHYIKGRLTLMGALGDSTSGGSTDK